MRLRDFLILLKDAALGWNRDNASRLSASLAYYAIFSMAPLLMIVSYIVGIFFGTEAAQGKITEQLNGLVGNQVASTIQTSIEILDKSRGVGIWATIIGFVLVFIGAAGVFGELEYAINAIWGNEKKERAFAKMWKTRLLSIALILSIGFLLLISLVVSSVLAGLSHHFAPLFPMGVHLSKWSDILVFFLISGMLFASIFKIIRLSLLFWKPALVGGMLTSLLFTIGKTGIAWYVGRVGVTSGFGAAGSVVIILLWVYYTACILFFGAEFTKLYQQRYCT